MFLKIYIYTCFNFFQIILSHLKQPCNKLLIPLSVAKQSLELFPAVMCHCHYRVPEEQSLLRTGDLPGDSIQAHPILILFLCFLLAIFPAGTRQMVPMRNGFTQTHIIICTLLKKLYFSLLAIKLQGESAVTTP